MGKAVQYLLLLSVIIAVFYVLGLAGGDGGLISMIIDWGNIEQSNLWVTIFYGTLIAFGSVGAIVVGIFSNIKLEQVATALVTAWMLPYFLAILDIGLKIKNTLDSSLGSSIGTTVTLLVCGPMVIFTIFTLFEWWRMKD